MTARFAPTEITADVSALSQPDRDVLAKLIEASKILESLPRVRVRVDVEMEDGLKPIRNVIATLRGKKTPDRWVVVGTHHDAWTFGGIDPGSATAARESRSRNSVTAAATSAAPCRAS